MSYAENKLHWCLRKAEKEGKNHRGLRIVSPDLELAKQHVQKAQHNLRVVDYLIKGGFTDWAINAGFYTLYHCLLAILTKNGYETRNQECTFVAVGVLIAQGKTDLSLDLLQRIASLDSEPKKEVFIKLREDAQYGVGTRVEDTIIKKMLIDVKNCIEIVKSDVKF